MILEKLNIEGCYQIKVQNASDSRGFFSKYYVKSDFNKVGLDFQIHELYFSSSKRNVIRGMHYQKKPFEHAKLVNCLLGAVQDVILDLRVDSLTFGMFQSLILSMDEGNAIYLPPGVAHGFSSLTENCIVGYAVSSEYSKEFDSGILWNSFGYDWGIHHPVMSKRDIAFPAFDQKMKFF